VICSSMTEVCTYFTSLILANNLLIRSLDGHWIDLPDKFSIGFGSGQGFYVIYLS
jgi:hypothetical protein